MTDHNLQPHAPQDPGHTAVQALHRPLVVGAGFIGSRLSSTLHDRGVDVTAVTRSDSDNVHILRRRGVRVIVSEASNSPLITQLTADIDHIFYCAGGLLPAASNLAPTTNITLSIPPLLSVLDAVRTQPHIGLTFLSSGGTVYGNPQKLPVSEDHPTEPLTAYGVEKLSSEKYVSMYGKLYGIRAHILRCSNVYGEGQPADRGQGAVAVFLDCLMKDKTITIFGDGSQIRDYIHVDDVVDTMMRLAVLADHQRIFNVGSGQGHSLTQLMEMITSITECEPHIDWQPTRGFDVQRIVLDITRLKNVIPFMPRDFREGLQALWKYLQLPVQDRVGL